MNYAETIDYLYTRLPLFSRIGPAAFKKDLSNTLALCVHLGNPERGFPSVHIAGTNGKGSVSHMLAAILQKAGYKTGLYTSPHLKDFRERIRIDGEMIPENEVVSLVESLIPMIEKIEPSFFEITVAMAFAWFRKAEVDIAIIETGLGGRLDSTNVIMPQLSVITQIGYDHQSMLGNTLSEIAGEKAGIIKTGVPVVIGERHPETDRVFEAKAADERSILHYAADWFRVQDWHAENSLLLLEVQEKGHIDSQHYELDLPGIYQLKNIRTVLASVRQLQELGWVIGTEAIRAGLRQTKKLTGLHGRWEKIADHPTVILEVAHNEDGIREMNAQIELCSYRNLHIVLGIVRDKDPSRVLQLLPAEASYYFTAASIPRALEASELAAAAGIYGLKGNVFSNVNLALNAANTKAHKDDLIVVCGSIFLIAEVEN